MLLYVLDQRNPLSFGHQGNWFSHRLNVSKVEMRPVDEKEEAVELAPVLENSLAWASFMAVSSNLRYQTVNCIEERLLVSPFLQGSILITISCR